MSHTVEFFLQAASRYMDDKRFSKFEVIVVENSPKYSGHTLCKSLAAEKIKVTLISDAAIFAIMPRVSKVIIGTTAGKMVLMCLLCYDKLFPHCRFKYHSISEWGTNCTIWNAYGSLSSQIL